MPDLRQDTGSKDGFPQGGLEAFQRRALMLLRNRDQGLNIGMAEAGMGKVQLTWVLSVFTKGVAREKQTPRRGIEEFNVYRVEKRMEVSLSDV